MAIGKANVNIDIKKISLKIGQNKILQKGEIYFGYDESQIAQYMKNEKIDITVDIGLGSKNFTVYTMDLTKKYIDINADYRS